MPHRATGTLLGLEEAAHHPHRANKPLVIQSRQLRLFSMFTCVTAGGGEHGSAELHIAPSKGKPSPVPRELLPREPSNRAGGGLC